MDKKKWRVFCVLGDGELQEGSVWEAAMSAGHYKLNNLVAIVDRNRVQIDGQTEDVMGLEPLQAKWEAFNWHVIQCDGNNISQIKNAFAEAGNVQDKPIVLLAHTKMGAGISSIENDYRWHGKAPDSLQSEQFIQELNTHHEI